LGGRRIRGALGNGYFDWLGAVHEGSSGNADLVAHFYRRVFELLRENRSLGLIATNTIAQGDTRETGLRWICTHGGTIYNAQRRVAWPGQAAVVVSVVSIYKGEIDRGFEIDGQEVPQITAFLFHAGGHDNPSVLEANSNMSFIGTFVLGMGFTFDDTDTKGVASSISKMDQLIEKDPRNGDQIFPYIGGEEVNTSPNQAHHRYIINFEDWPLQREDLGVLWVEAEEEERKAWLREGIVPLDYPGSVAEDYPDLLSVIEERVKPERTRKKADGAFALRSPLPQRWWHYADKRPALYNAIEGLKKVLVTCQTSRTQAFTFLPNRMICSHKIVIFPFDSYAMFSVLQSGIHSLWVRTFASTMKDDTVYTPSDCFETFPLPSDYTTHSALEEVGQTYYDFRADLMVRNDEVLTKTYNRFHNPEEQSPDILRLRARHAAMDRAVLDAYGWDDIETTCEFLLDYEEEEDEDGGSARRRKKPWRYRWPDAVRDEVLARLLALNKERAIEEELSGLAAEAKEKKKGKGGRRGKGEDQTEFGF